MSFIDIQLLQLQASGPVGPSTYLYMWGNNTFGLLGDNRALTTYFSWTSISSGGSHTSAVRSDGTLWAWGFNASGQLGDGTTANKSSPVQVGYSSWLSVSSGGYHTLAIDRNYAIYSWGLNSYGQLGDGTTIDKSYPSLVYANNVSFTSVSAGAYHSLALTDTNVLYSWGDNESGQLGTNTTIFRSSPVQVGSYTQIDAGKLHSGAIDSLGKLYTWGANPFSQLGQSDTVYRSSPTQLGTSSWTMMAGGGGHTLAINSDNKLFAWGNNVYGQVGNNPTYTGNFWTKIATGPNHMLALRSDGKLFARGLNTSGQLGDGTTVNRSSIVQIGSGTWSDISVGYDHSLALSSNGTLWSWGDNTYGQLNQQDTIITYDTSRSWTQFSRNYRGGGIDNYVLGIKSDGSLWAWGKNNAGQLGIGGTAPQSSPVQVGTATSWASVTTVPGAYTTLALDTTGQLWGWGYNPDGQLPGGPAVWPVAVGASIDVPTLFTLNGKLWSQIDGGSGHVIGRLIPAQSSFLYTWGFNDFGQLMTNDLISRSSPVNIGTNSLGALWVSAGTNNSAYIRGNGVLYTCGNNDYGQLGNGTPGIYRSSQVQVTASGISWTQVTAGEYYVGAISTTYKLYTWGQDAYGVLGQRPSGDRSVPTQITSVIPSTYNDFTNTSFVSVSTGYQTMSATDSTGRIFLWGHNNLGQLGDGTSVDKSFPVQITDYTGVWPAADKIYFKKSNGTYYGAGDNDWGELGIGTSEIVDRSSPVLALAGRVPNIYDRSSPTQVGTSSWTQISAGLYNSIGINTNNNMIGWGINTTGKVGAIDVVGYSWKAMSMNDSTTLAIRSDNTLWSWGNNANGQLGLNSTVNRSSPSVVGSETETSWSQVSVGGSHSLAIKTDGSLWGWGSSDNNQLSNLSWTLLDAGTDHAVAIRSDGRLFAMGSGTYQKGEISAVRSYPVQIATSINNFIKVVATDVNTLALDSEGSLYTVGSYRYGQTASYPDLVQGYGDGPSSVTSLRAVPMTLFDNTPLQDISTGFKQTYFLDILNRVWMIGNSGYGDGNNTALIRHMPELLGSTTTSGTYSTYNYGIYNSNSPMYPAFSGSSMNFTGAFTIEFWVFTAYGDLPVISRGAGAGNTNIDFGFTNSYGAEQCLYGTVVIGGVTYGGRFTAAGGASPQFKSYAWMHVAMSRYSTNVLYGFIDGVRQAVSYTGVVGTVDLSATANYYGPMNSQFMWGGWISNFRICNIAVYTSTTYTKPTGPFSATQIANPFGGSGTAAITGTQCLLLTYQDATPIDNSTFAQSPVYGGASQQEPGLDWYYPNMTNFSPFSNNITAPVTNASYLQLASGFGHTLGIQADYTLWSWGLNTSGQLGLNDKVNRSSPIQIGTSSWSMIAAGMYHSAGITVDNKLFMWGNNEFGQLGLNDKIFRSQPVQLTSPEVSWTMVKTKYYHTVATASTNYTYGWGNNIFQQLGPNAGTISYIQISSGIANTSKGETLGWGWNFYMRFGVAQPYSTSSGWSPPPWSHPVQIQTNISDVSWSYANSSAYIPNNYWGKTMFVRTDGTLWGVGKNQYGDLGTGDTVARSSPTQIGFDTNWSFVLSGSNRNTFAIKTNGTLWSWGYSQGVGSLGLIDTIDRSSPVQVPGSWSIVSPGNNHTLALKSDGTLWSWGSNSNGQLGTTDRISKSSPVQITTDTYLDIAAGNSYSLAVPSTGILLAWGNNNIGQLGTQDLVARSSPTQIGLMTTWSKVSASYIPHSLGLNGLNLYAWGSNTNGELGVNDNISRSSPTLVSGGHTWLDMDAESISAAIRTDHTIWTWGANNRTGIIGTSNRSAPTQILSNNTVNVLSPILITTSQLTNISTGYTMTFLQYANSGGIVSMGLNGFGQLGLNTVSTTGVSTPTQIYNIGSTINRSSPVQLGTLSWNSVAAGLWSTVGITNNGVLYAWGDNTYGQLGDGTTINKSYPVSIGDSGWTALGGQELATIALRGSALYAWGTNTYGQLGQNDIVSRSSPVQISGSYTNISLGGNSVYAIDSSSVLWAWGLNTNGQLGIGVTSFGGMRSSPVQVGSFTSVTGGLYHALAEKSDGTLWAWGYGVWGALGISSIISYSSPVQVGSYKILGAGTFALTSGIKTSEGFAFMMGLNGSGQLGIGAVTNRSSPTQVYATAPESSYRAPVRIGLSSWTYVAAGVSHTMAVKADNTLWAWGLGTSGQLGNTSTVNRSSPVQVTVGTSNTFTKLAPGDQHSMAITSNFSLWAWGLNSSGQLGINTNSNRSSPVQVSGVFAEVESGASHSIALTPDGTLYTWGANLLNQLGNGDTVDRSSPVQVTTNALTTNARYTMLSTYQNNSIGLTMASDILGWGNSTFVTGSSPIVISASDAVNYTVSSPVQIGTSSWSQVSAGDNSSIGLQADGTVDTWGLNNYGQLGLNDTLNRSSPVQIGSDTYSNVSAGYDFNALRKSDGKTYLFGKNDLGQVGDLT